MWRGEVGARYVSAQKKADHSSLIEIRKDFIPEMLKTLEDI